MSNKLRHMQRNRDQLAETLRATFRTMPTSDLLEQVRDAIGGLHPEMTGLLEPTLRAAADVLNERINYSAAAESD